MSLLKGSYKLKDVHQSNSGEASADKLLEQEYYKAALGKLGGSIAFIMKGKTFLWTGDDSKAAAAPDETGKKENK